MSKKATQLFVHIGPIREESQHIMQTAALPTFIATLEKKPSRLEALHNSLPELYVAECPISTEGGEAMLYEYNIAELSSIAPATGLKMLYPGLAEKQHRPAETHTLEAALKAHQLSDTPVTQLMIEQPEIAQQLLNALEAQGQLQALKKLWLRTSPESLYAEMPTQTELLATCEQLGFEVVNIQADDPDFPLVECKRNPLYHAHKQLQHKAAKLEQQHTEQTKALDAVKHELGELKQQQDQLKKQRDEQAAAKEKAQAETDQLKKERDEQAAAKDKAQAEVSQLKKQRDEQAAAKDQALAEIEQLKKQREEQAAAKDKVQVELAQLKQERDKLNKQQETLRQQLREQQQENQQLREEVKATDERQNKLNVELERAEAQLELIKDLLLKDRLLSND